MELEQLIANPKLSLHTPLNFTQQSFSVIDQKKIIALFLMTSREYLGLNTEKVKQ